MKTLFIDTHYLDIHIILFENGEIVKRKDIIGEKNNSCFLMPAINEVCTPTELNQVVVVNGPGSFTGVRLGVTIAKTLSYTLNIPIKVITYFDVLFASNGNKDGIYIIKDNNGYYVCEYSNNISTNKFSYIYNKDYESYKQNKELYENIEVNYIDVYKFIQNVSSVNPHGVKPLYIKLIGVEYDKKNK